MGNEEMREELRHHELFKEDVNRDRLDSWLDEEDELEEMLRRNHRERVLLTVVALLMIAGASFLYLTSP